MTVLNRAPSVYVPVEPEDNGIALPAILSLIVHGSILAFIALTYQAPSIEDNPTIETSIITPEELASLQAEIQANRETLAAGGVPETPEISTQPPPPPPSASTDSSYIGGDSAFSRGISSIFNNSIDSTPEPVGANDSSDPVFTELSELPEASQAEELSEKTETKSAAEDSKPIKNTPKVTANTDHKGQLSATFPSGTEGNKNKSTSGTGTASQSTGSGSSKSSSGDISGALISLIEPHWTPPVGKVGAAVSVSVTVDENGNVLSVNANTSDPELKQSLESAVNRASPLTPVIGTNKRRLKLNFIVR